MQDIVNSAAAVLETITPPANTMTWTLLCDYAHSLTSQPRNSTRCTPEHSTGPNLLTVRRCDWHSVRDEDK